MKKILIFILLMFLSMNLSAEIERRAALDLGSGSFKLLVADVDTETQEIVKYVYSNALHVPLSDALQKNTEGQFSEALQSQALDTIDTLVHLAKKHQSNRMYGIATEAFRQVKNGEDFADRISRKFNFPIQILSQKEEGEIGFYSAVRHSKGNPDHAVVWDNGSGSFQITWKENGKMHSYMGPYGKIPVKNLIISTIQKKDINTVVSPNPISAAEAEATKIRLIELIGPVPEKLKEKLQNPLTKVYGIGAIHHGNICISINKSSYTRQDVQQLTLSRLNMNDEQLSNKNSSNTVHSVSDLIFIHTLMSHLGIHSVIDMKTFDDPHVKTTGNTVGVILDSSYWKRENKTL